MTNNLKFEKSYKEFNTWAKEHYPKLETMEYLERNYSLSPYANQLAYFRRVRNLLAHDGNIGATPAENMINVTNEMLTEFSRLRQEIEQPVINRAIPLSKIFYKSLDDKIIDASLVMKKKGYTHIPIVENNKVIGLFGEKSLFDIVCDGHAITSETTFREIFDYIAIEDKNGDKNNMIVEFVTPDATIPECKHKFSYAVNNNHRLDIVFITENGKSNGLLQGLVTIWDLPTF